MIKSQVMMLLGFFYLSIEIYLLKLRCFDLRCFRGDLECSRRLHICHWILCSIGWGAWIDWVCILCANRIGRCVTNSFRCLGCLVLYRSLSRVLYRSCISASLICPRATKSFQEPSCPFTVVVVLTLDRLSKGSPA